MRTALIALVAATVALGACTSERAERTSPSSRARATPISSASVRPAGEPTDADSTRSRLLSTLRGAPLRGPTRLKLLADTDVLDVDRRTRRPIAGLPGDSDTRWAQRANGHLVITDDCLDCVERPTVFVVRRGRYVANRIATGVFVTPGRRGLWTKSFDTATSCSLAKISLEGKTVRPARPIGCEASVIEETALGLIVSGGVYWALLDPTDLHEVGRWVAPSRIHAVVGRRVLIRDAKGFALVNPWTKTEIRLDEPDSVGHPGRGTVSPDGRYVAIEYRDPSQFMDLWVLDVVTRRWIHAPSMPVHALIKRPEPSWTPDGRLVVVGFFGERTNARFLLVVWRPGRAKLAIREITEDAWFVV